MRTVITSEVLAAIAVEASDSPMREICGLLFGESDRVTAHLSCRNIASDPHVAFELCPSELLAAHRRARRGGPAIVGCYHSHPTGPPVPSMRDAVSASPDNSLWLLYAEQNFGLWRAQRHGTNGRRFRAVPFKVADWLAPVGAVGQSVVT